PEAGMLLLLISSGGLWEDLYFLR
ncbi:Hypothetical protein DEACI_1604, partial [Acididesulfobacillus acetoxydans]